MNIPSDNSWPPEDPFPEDGSITAYSTSEYDSPELDIDLAHDSLVLASALQESRDEVRGVAVFRRQFPSGGCHVLAMQDGRLWDPIVDQNVEGKPLRVIAKRGKIRSHLLGRMWLIRTAMLLAMVDSPEQAHSALIDGVAVGPGKWAFEPEGDPIGERLAELRFAGLKEAISLFREPRRGQVPCPLDGPVAPLEIDFISPPWTWQSLCGRQWRALVCPECFACFGSVQVAMN